jgi:hypothetical protein
VLLGDLYYFLLALALYSVIIYCSVSIWLHLRRAVRQLSTTVAEQSRTREFSGQINAALLAQAVVPSLLEMLPLSLIFVNDVLNYYSGWRVTAILFLFLNWSPVLNALCVLLIVRPYRRALLGWVGVSWRGTVSVYPVPQRAQMTVSRAETVPSSELCNNYVGLASDGITPGRD